MKPKKKLQTMITNKSINVEMNDEKDSWYTKLKRLFLIPFPACYQIELIKNGHENLFQFRNSFPRCFRPIEF